MNIDSLRTNPSLLSRLRTFSNQQDWEHFVDRYGPHIYRSCRQWQLQEADAQDVMQAVLVKLARQIRDFQYDAAKGFRGYLKTLTHHALCDFLEARKRPGVGSGDTQELEKLSEVAAHDDLAARLADEYDLELVQHAFFQVGRRVEKHTWEAFRLTALEGRPGAEVARELGMAIAQVFRAKSKVLKMVRDEVRKQDPDLDDTQVQAALRRAAGPV